MSDDDLISPAYHPDPVTEAAIDWMVLLGSGDVSAEQYAAFDAWIAEHVDHRNAWQSLDSLLNKPLETLRESGASMPVNTRFVERLTAVQPSLNRRKLLRNGASVFALVSAGSVLNMTRVEPDYASEIGQRRHFYLDDGTRLDLNARSSVINRFGEHERVIELYSGQILLTVAESIVPFRVTLGYGSASSSGRFMLRRDRQRDVVTALEQDVSVLHNSGYRQTVLPGESFSLDKHGVTAMENHLLTGTDWLDGVLDVKDEKLVDVVAALKPYCHGYVRVSPEAQSLRVFGLFQLDDPDLLETLADVLSIRRIAIGNWVTLLDRA